MAAWLILSLTVLELELMFFRFHDGYKTVSELDIDDIEFMAWTCILWPIGLAWVITFFIMKGVKRYE